MKLLLIFAFIFSAFISVNAQNEYAPIVEKEISYKNFEFKRFGDEKKADLRDLVKGKKLVMVVYFAPWCHTWHHQKPFTETLYTKYKDKGLEIIGVSNYATLDELKNDFGNKSVSFPVVIESENSADRMKTTHYDYRQKTGDTRKWGSPYTVFLEPEKLNKKGDVLTEKTFVVNGELIEADTEKFIREKLGLKDEPKKETAEKKSAKIESCKEGAGKLDLKKP